MLKILIVDDEIILRKGLSKSISKVKDFVVAGEAGDGLQALKLIEEVEPDVVITDIRMPNMDGKELVQVLSEKYPELKKVVISGFEDFTYVRHTMKNGAVDYLLKPVEDDKLYALLKEIQESIRMDKKKKDEFIDHNIKLNESFPILKDRFLHGVLTAGQPYESSEDIARKLNYYGINFTPEDRFTLLFISIDNY
ncbi:response regulator [Ruminiclostridium cellobioparum]|uniref:Stage 0 sporulation protein A homolog n=1 Tax=Ruminiclostridium cellobioparum subsp. termitidis CT1112 TaxID=1195236 RepID=S0FG12_RUMCE|nr:response regulator [Ruminiclostridium cellobioparum]EMS70135.1 two component transcriptional regulator, AraC family protein [Ruminiclostridium cellobioparum subsp. termitidis CT1112]